MRLSSQDSDSLVSFGKIRGLDSINPCPPVCRLGVLTEAFISSNISEVVLDSTKAGHRLWLGSVDSKIEEENFL